MWVPGQAKGCRVIPPSLHGLVWHSEKALSFTSCWEGWVQAGWSFLCQVLGCVKSSEKEGETRRLEWILMEAEDIVQFSPVWLFATPWTAARQASLSITNSWSLLKFMPTESVMPSNHLILCHPLLLQPSIFPSIRVFSYESALHIRWPEYWTFSFNISPSNEHSGLISFRMDWSDLLAVHGTLNSLLQHHSSKEGKAARVFLSRGPGGRVLTVCLEPTGLACRVYLEIQSAGKPWESRWGIWQKSYDTIHPHTGEQRAGESVQSCFRKSKYNSIGGQQAQSG